MVEARGGVPDWFEPRSWGERGQLLVHLLRNAAAPVYLRAPPAAGKTRFLEHLLERSQDDFLVIRLNAAASADVVGAVAAALPGGAGQSGLGAALANAPRPVLIALDDADRLAESAGSGVAALARAGAQLLLVGRGGPAWLVADERVQVVDLPPFTPEETRDFALALDPAQGRRLARDGGPALYAATGGRPGAIRARLAAGGAGAPARAAARLAFWLGGGALAALLAVVLWKQDAINAWFDTAEPAVPPQAVRAPDPAGTPPAVPAPAPQAAAPALEPPIEPLVIAEIEDLAQPAGPPPGVEAAPEPVEPRPEPPAPPPSDAGPGAPAPGVQPVEPEPSAPAAKSDEEPVEAEPPAPEPEAPEPPPKPPAPPAPEPERGRLLGPEWLWAQPPQHFTLQLVGARDTTAIRKFVARHGLEGSLAVFERELAGRPWFSLLHGSFPSRQAAERQRARLPAPIRKDVWIRTFGDIRQYLGPGP